MTFPLKLSFLHSGSYTRVFQQNKWKLNSGHPVPEESRGNANSWITCEVIHKNLKEVIQYPMTFLIQSSIFLSSQLCSAFSLPPECACLLTITTVSLTARPVGTAAPPAHDREDEHRLKEQLGQEVEAFKSGFSSLRENP